jgi:hypothetical protein
MNLNPGTRTLLVALTVAGSALVAPAMALAETPAPEGPVGPVDVANPIDEPEPQPCDDPSDCLANPTEPEPCDDPGDCLTNPTDDPDDGGDDGDPGGQEDGDGPHVTPPSDVDEPILANPTFTG